MGAEVGCPSPTARVRGLSQGVEEGMKGFSFQIRKCLLAQVKWVSSRETQGNIAGRSPGVPLGDHRAQV